MRKTYVIVGPSKTHRDELRAYAAEKRVTKERPIVRIVDVKQFTAVEVEAFVHDADALMYYETVKAAEKYGFEWGEMSWILENNDAMNRPIEMFGSTAAGLLDHSVRRRMPLMRTINSSTTKGFVR